jgi:hypothetical protein
MERGYAVLGRSWRKGDLVELDLPMPVERIAAHPRVKDNAGQVALQRGPLVYCVEACDLPGALGSVYLPLASQLTARKDDRLLGGIVTIRTEAESMPQPNWTRALYQKLEAPNRIPLTAVPYYAWDNRAAGDMRVWLRTAPPIPAVAGLESQAQVTLSFVSGNCQPLAINDGIEPKNSGEQPAANCHWWPHKGGTEWAQYTWPKPVRVRGARVYWFDDTGRGACRLPAGWHIEYLSDGSWKPVSSNGSYDVAKDKWCESAFDRVTTTGLRLVVRLQPEWAAGVHEWRLIEDDESDLEQ